jgi:CheY-like chemotaxis protein
MSDALSGRGYYVIQAADGWDAIRLAGEYDVLIHALVTDFHMSGLDGRRLLHVTIGLCPARRLSLGSD